VSESIYIVEATRRNIVKIGFSKNVKKRIADLQSASVDAWSLRAVFPGGRDLERRLHALFAELRIRNEFFHFDALISSFLDIAEYKSLAVAIEHVERWNAWSRKPRDERMAIERKRRRATTIPIYPHDWNEARLEVNRRKVAKSDR
jgi:hypothetical protein